MLGGAQELVEGFGGGSPAEGFAGSDVEGERDGVELATLGWVHWHNHQRLHTYLGDTPPAEFEAAYAGRQADCALVGNQ